MKKEEHNARFRDHYIAIGIRISYFRKLRGLSQEQLAERAGISPGFLSQVEAPGMAVGISLSTLFLIAEALEIPPSACCLRRSRRLPRAAAPRSSDPAASPHCLPELPFLLKNQ